MAERVTELERELVSVEIRESAFMRTLAQEQKDGFWTSLDASATKRNRSWKDVEQNLKDAYSAWCVNPYARSYIDYTRFFVIGKGTQITTDDGDEATEMIRLFCDLNDWQAMEKCICEELYRDGEVFVRFHDKNRNDLEATVAAISLIDPLEIQAIDAKDVNSPSRYLRVWTETLGYDDNGTPQTENRREWIEANEIHHIKVNASHNETRGRSDLLVALPYMRQLKRWMDDMSRRNYFANSFIWDVETKGSIKPSTVTAAYPTGPQPGSVIAHTENEKWSVNAPDMKYSDSTAGSRAIKLLLMAAFKQPESWYGDTGESNLATTKALAMPTLRAFIDKQDFLKAHFEAIIQRGARVEDVEVTFPEIEAEDAKLKAEGLAALSTALTNFLTSGLLSRESAYAILQGQLDELDEWDADSSGVGEKAKIEAEEQGDVLAIAQGQKMGSVPRPSIEGETGGTVPA